MIQVEHHFRPRGCPTHGINYLIRSVQNDGSYICIPLEFLRGKDTGRMCAWRGPVHHREIWFYMFSATQSPLMFQ